MAMAEARGKKSDSESFDIVSKYHSLLSNDADLSPPIAAIESLIALLASSPATTVSETVDLLSRSSYTLRSAVRNGIALSAGTDLFQRFLMQSLNRPGTGSNATGLATVISSDFGHLRQHLISNGRLFVQRAKKARARIAEEGRPFIRGGSTVLTNGGSRVVSTLLLRAADAFAGGFGFRVICVLPSALAPSSTKASSITAQLSEGHQLTTTLRAHSIPVSLIPYSALAAALPLADLVLVGAESVAENGGIISRLGTHQIGLLARTMGKPFYVAAESYKFVRLYPLGMTDLTIRQQIVNFTPTEERSRGDDDDDDISSSEQQQQKQEEYSASISIDDDNNVTTTTTSPAATPKPKNQRTTTNPPLTPQNGLKFSPNPKMIITDLEREAVDFTPPNLISAIITENGVLTPSAVSEELVKLWF